jgi:dihydropteroate synthase
MEGAMSSGGDVVKAGCIWRAGQFTFVFPRPALVMGVVNVTPDSFSDGGRFLDPARAVEHALQLVAEGADILDIGGESTRPGAEPVGEAEELRRVVPVLEGLAGRVNVPLSVDTCKPAVARVALAAGASIVNDIAANRSEPTMWETVAAAGAGYIAMHMRGEPATMQIAPHYDDVVEAVKAFLRERLAKLAAAGVPAERVVLDPGLGFGKTVEHNLDLLAGVGDFSILRRPLLLGISRKSFVGKLLGADVTQRLPGTLAATVWARREGVQLFRTHDVAATAQALRMTEALVARCENESEV